MHLSKILEKAASETDKLKIFIVNKNNILMIMI